MNTVKQICILLCVFGCSFMYSQNNDSLFVTAQQFAYSKNYQKAEALCQKLIKEEPNNTDYKIFLGRIYAWQNKFGASIKILKTVTELNPNNSDAYDALTDAQLWSGDYKGVISNCNLILPTTDKSQKEIFLLKQAKAYHLMGDDDSALKKLDEILKEFPGNTAANDLKIEIVSHSYKNAASVSYLNVSFNNPAFPSWHFAYLEYQRKLKKCPVIGRFNYGNSATMNGYQFEVDAYPKFGKGTYAYLNAGYSTSKDLFPSQRAGAELYQKLPYAFEISGGLRYMHFETEDVFIYTAYLGKYYKNLWFAYRPFVVNKSSDFFVSHTGIIRKYFANEDNYLSLNLIYGATPYTTTSFQDIAKVNSKRIGVDAQIKLGKNFLIKPMLSYEYEEYYPDLFRNRLYSQLTLTKRF